MPPPGQAELDRGRAAHREHRCSEGLTDLRAAARLLADKREAEQLLADCNNRLKLERDRLKRERDTLDLEVRAARQQALGREEQVRALERQARRQQIQDRIEQLEADARRKRREGQQADAEAAARKKPARAREIEIWIRAFIPNRHDSNRGYLQPVPGRPWQTMFKNPLPDRKDLIRRCSRTDDRTFSSDKDASARIGGRATVRLDWPTVPIGEIHPPSQSVEVDCETGAETCRENVDTSRSKFGPVIAQGDIVRLMVHGEAAHACFLVAPDIHYDGEFIIDLAANTVRFAGKIGRFPAFEAYFQIDRGPVRAIFQQLPVPGSDVRSVPLPRWLHTDPVEF